MTHIQTPYGPKTPEMLCRAMDALEVQPELLAALEGLLDCITDPRIETLGINHNIPIERARSAIAKARGETP